jgi:hypothetical protein
MKTLYQSKGAVKVGEHTLSDGYSIAVAMTNDPTVIDTIACQADRVPERKLLVLHGGDGGTWSTDQEWSARHPETYCEDVPYGYTCHHCHEPVVGHISLRTRSVVRHIRQFCGCTMLLMATETVAWWLELSGEEAWNGLVVGGAKQAHKRYGL